MSHTLTADSLTDLLTELLDENFISAVLSGSSSKESFSKCRLRRIRLKDGFSFQAEELKGKQAFHKNMDAPQAAAYMAGLLGGVFKQAQILTSGEEVTVLISKKGTVTVKRRKKAGEPALPAEHNRVKRYILEEGIPIPFLVDLGVMTEEGKIVRARYDKFRQINRFLEFIEDILPQLPKGRELTILDFGCGKSYLTFAVYYYLKILKGYPVRIIGLDLKADVIRHCSALAESYGYDGLSFLQGDIADYEGCTQVDMVITLHACDTATDYALFKAVRWGAKVILSVPCCQHELNRQLENEVLAPILGYGLIKERLSALVTDGVRAQILERCGYRTQILEFIDMEHTPKNILIRAVYQGKPADNGEELAALEEFLHIAPTLEALFKKEEGK